MADEISAFVKLAAIKGSLSMGRQLDLTANMAGSVYQGGVQTIGTTQEAIDIGDVGTAGLSLFINADDTHYVEIGLVVSATFYPLAKLKPGEPAFFRLGTNTFYAKANTASVNLEKYILPD